MLKSSLCHAKSYISSVRFLSPTPKMNLHGPWVGWYWRTTWKLTIRTSLMACQISSRASASRTLVTHLLLSGLLLVSSILWVSSVWCLPNTVWEVTNKTKTLRMAHYWIMKVYKFVCNSTRTWLKKMLLIQGIFNICGYHFVIITTTEE